MITPAVLFSASFISTIAVMTLVEVLGGVR